MLRDSVVIFISEMESLRRVKDDVRKSPRATVRYPIARFGLKEGDIIEAFIIEKVAAELPVA